MAQERFSFEQLTIGHLSRLRLTVQLLGDVSACSQELDRAKKRLTASHKPEDRIQLEIISAIRAAMPANGGNSSIWQHKLTELLATAKLSIKKQLANIREITPDVLSMIESQFAFTQAAAKEYVLELGINIRLGQDLPFSNPAVSSLNLDVYLGAQAERLSFQRVQQAVANFGCRNAWEYLFNYLKKPSPANRDFFSLKAITDSIEVNRSSNEINEVNKKNTKDLILSIVFRNRESFDKYNNNIAFTATEAYFKMIADGAVFTDRDFWNTRNQFIAESRQIGCSREVAGMFFDYFAAVKKHIRIFNGTAGKNLNAEPKRQAAPVQTNDVMSAGQRTGTMQGHPDQSRQSQSRQGQSMYGQTQMQNYGSRPAQSYPQRPAQSYGQNPTQNYGAYGYPAPNQTQNASGYPAYAPAGSVSAKPRKMSGKSKAIVFTVLFLIVVIVALILIIWFNRPGEGNNNNNNNNNNNAVAGCEITVSDGAGITITGTNILVNLRNSTASYDLVSELIFSSGATYALFTDSECTVPFSGSKVNLSPGDNVYYIRVVSQDKSAAKNYTITINRNTKLTVGFYFEGGLQGTASVDIGVLVNEPVPPIKVGYTLDGWYTSASFGGAAVSFPYTVNSDIDLFAKMAPNLNRLVFDKNAEDASGQMEEQSIYTDASAKLIGNRFLRQGYSFGGWAESKSGAALYQDGASYKMGNAPLVTLYAVWSAITNSVVYDYQGATGGNDEQHCDVTAMSSYTLAVPTKTGYTFDGWYNRPGGGGTRYTNASGVSISPWNESTGLILYAHWLGTNGLEYAPRGTTAYTVSMGTANTNGAVYIQSHVNGLPVTHIAASAFENCAELSYIGIPETVVNIGASAFDGCSKLTSVRLPDNLTTLGGFAFWGCDITGTLTIPRNLTSFGSRAFSSQGMDGDVSKSKITGFAVADGNIAFRTDGNFLLNGSVLVLAANRSDIPANIPGSLGTITTIADSAFYGCNLITNFNIPSTVTDIRSYAFGYCTGLSTITVPQSVTVINSYTFSDCVNLTQVILHNSITAIYNGAFSDCGRLSSTGLTNILPSSLTILGDFAFYFCSSLTGDLVVPGGVSSVGTYVFYTNSLYGGSGNFNSITILYGVVEIGNSAFSNNLTRTVTIAASVTKVGSSAFWLIPPAGATINVRGHLSKPADWVDNWRGNMGTTPQANQANWGYTGP